MIDDEARQLCHLLVAEGRMKVWQMRQVIERFEERRSRGEAIDFVDHLGDEGFESVAPERPTRPDPTAPLTAGSAIDGMVVLGEISRGGMGVVHRVREEATGRELALKLALHPQDRERFRREARLLARLSHPNIPPVLSMGEIHDGIYFTMPLLEGDRLSNLVHGRRLSIEETLRIVAVVARAVDHAHEAGVLHRDLKSENIVVASDGTPHLIDFGLAIDDEAAGARDRVTGTHQVLGTLDYLTPEHVAGSMRGLDRRSDTFALGVTLYHAACGVFPFPASSAFELAALFESGRAPDPRQVDRRVDDRLAAVLCRAIAIDPDDRYPTAGALADDLDRYLAGQEVEAPRPAHPSSRGRWPVVAGLVLAIALGGAWMASRGEDLDPPAREEDVSPAERARRSARLAEILDDIDRGLVRPDRPPEAPRLEGLIVEASAARDEATIETLAAALDPLIDAARSARAAGDPDRWTDAERDRVRFVVGVLERSGSSARSVEVLGRWLAVVEDRQLAIETGAALCNLGHPDAIGPLLAARDRFGPDSPVWLQVSTRLRRVPVPPAGRSDDPDALLARGIVLSCSGDATAALAALDRAHERAPGRADILRERGRLRSVAGDLEGALDDLTRALEAGSDPFGTLLDRGAVRQERGDLPGALADFDRAIAEAPDRAIGYLYRALVHQWAGRFPEAERDYERSIEIDPRDGLTYFNRAGLREHTGDLDGALRDLNRAIEWFPTRAAFVTSRGALHERMGDAASAVRDYDRALEIDPRETRALWRRAAIRLRQGDLATAAIDLDRAIEAGPDSPVPYDERAQLRRQKGDLEGALADLERALEIDPSAASRHARRGMLLVESGAPDRALEAIGAAVERAPENGAYRFLLGQCLEILGRLEEALATYRKGLELDPGEAEGHRRIGIVLDALGDREGALVELDRAVRLAPRFGHAYVSRARVRIGAEDFEGALPDLERAVGLLPEDWQLRVELGATYRRLARIGEAIASFEEARRRCPPAQVERLTSIIESLERER